ncbi:MAG: type I-G CRISPR-associated protein Csb2 [Bacilli bacterium]
MTKVNGFNAAAFGVEKGQARLTDALLVGELFHAGSVKLCTDDLITGQHERQARKGNHEHIAILSYDEDRDGYIEWVFVHATVPFPDEYWRRLPDLQGLWSADPPLHVAMRCEHIWRQGEGGEPGTWPDLFGESRVWVSAAPYFHPWYVKRNFGVADQVAKECQLRGLPVPRVSWRAATAGSREDTASQVAPAAFRSMRTRACGSEVRQPDTMGRFLAIEFPATVRGPLYLGYGCHFGLGTFIAQRKQHQRRDEDGR